jgi:hypothetical protein
LKKVKIINTVVASSMTPRFILLLIDLGRKGRTIAFLNPYKKIKFKILQLDVEPYRGHWGLMLAGEHRAYGQSGEFYFYHYF